MTSRFLATALLLSVSTPAMAQRVNLEDATLVVNAGEPVEVTINGQPVQMLIAPDAVAIPSVNADAAQRLGFDPSMIGYIYVIGPENLSFSTDTVRYEMQGGRFRRRTAFGDLVIVEGADGVAGPGALPQKQLVIQMRAGTPGDRALVFPLARLSRSQTGTLIEVGGVPIYVAFSFTRAESIVSATGGQSIADALGGYFDGEARETPILYRVSRPVRPLSLANPLMLGELEIRNLAVRVTDLGNADRIDEGPPAEGDPEEIVVTANTDDILPQRMYVGMDTIGHCANITYDFDAETVTLMCPPQPAAALPALGQPSAS